MFRGRRVAASPFSWFRHLRTYPSRSRGPDNHNRKDYKGYDNLPCKGAGTGRVPAVVPGHPATQAREECRRGGPRPAFHRPARSAARSTVAVPVPFVGAAVYLGDHSGNRRPRVDQRVTPLSTTTSLSTTNRNGAPVIAAVDHYWVLDNQLNLSSFDEVQRWQAARALPPRLDQPARRVVAWPHPQPAALRAKGTELRKGRIEKGNGS